jgi:hypothetical protein
MSSPINNSGSAKKPFYNKEDRVRDQQHPYYCSNMFNINRQYPYEESMNDFFAVNKANYDARHPRGTSHQILQEQNYANSFKDALTPASSPPVASTSPAGSLSAARAQPASPASAGRQQSPGRLQDSIAGKKTPFEYSEGTHTNTYQARPSASDTFSPPPFNPNGPAPAYPNPPPIGHNYTQVAATPTNFFAPPHRKTRRNREETVVLEPGFEWNHESLALLCKIKEVNKKGSEAAVASNKFPGKTAGDLDSAWQTRRAEARRYYMEVYGRDLPNKR